MIESMFAASAALISAATYLLGVHAGRAGAARRGSEDLVEIDRILGAWREAPERRSLIEGLVEGDRAARERDEK